MLDIFNRAVNYTVTNFGFSGTGDFINSTVHSKLMLITIPFAAISSYISTLFGLEVMTMIAIGVLLLLELLTGLIASKKKKRPIESSKFGRFGLKILVWFTLFFIVHSLEMRYPNDSIWQIFYEYLHGTIMIYVCLEYLISVLENFSAITGEDNNVLIRFLKSRQSASLPEYQKDEKQSRK